MAQKWKPFSDLEADPDLIEASLEDYRRVLAPFDGGVLERAWQILVGNHRFRCWPFESEFLAAARQAHRELRTSGIDEIAQQAQEMAVAYWKLFAKSAEATRARQGGYEGQLKRHVEAAARVQAQYMLGREGAGYDHDALFGAGPRDREAEDAWFARAYEQAASGQIKVAVPRNLIAAWKAEAQVEGRAK